MATKKKQIKTAADVLAEKQAELEAEKQVFKTLNTEYQELVKLAQEKNGLRAQSAKRIGEMEAVIKALGEVNG